MGKIKQIQAETALPLRKEVMWPNHPLSFSRIDNDSEGIHFGYYNGDQLLGVISVFIVGQRAQFRKFATKLAFQGQGIGTKLLKHVEAYAKAQDISILWCNARVEKTAFYEGFGMIKTDRYFEKAGKQYVIMEKDVR